MVQGLGVGADRLDAFGRKPLARFLVEARGIGVVLGAVGVFVVPAGVDDDDVTGPDVGGSVLQILGGDHPPFALRDRDDDAGAEEGAQRDLVQKRCSFHHVRRRVDVGAGMHDGGDLLGQHTTLGHAVESFDLHVLEVRPGRRAVSPGVGQVVELQRRFGGTEGPGERHGYVPLPFSLAWSCAAMCWASRAVVASRAPAGQSRKP
ncbi:Uncharacterised protein [Mycobacterium tuberculosis]|uniref:Uncharacterized protein n=1 Tax=Mycobacterium tuberculosis TaxID=1773 RepID=A0A655AK34_MYCTX|nr:Uncharacterised protein [Mycobacterium tuberculosis]